MLVYKQITSIEDPKKIEMNKVVIWVQVYDLPKGHSERDCNIIYTNPDKEIERTYNTWLRAPSKSTKINTGSRWLRNANGGGKWEEYGGSSKIPVAGSDREENDARIKEDGKVGAKNPGDNGEITVTARNQRRKIWAVSFQIEQTCMEGNVGFRRVFSKTYKPL
ncbi:hypothetical protein AgCh_027128 [Apium graveolens]